MYVLVTNLLSVIMQYSSMRLQDEMQYCYVVFQNIEHMENDHGVPLSKLFRDESFSFYSYIKLVNFFRKGVSDSKSKPPCICKLVSIQTSASNTGAKYHWAIKSQFIFTIPTLSSVYFQTFTNSQILTEINRFMKLK